MSNVTYVHKSNHKSRATLKYYTEYRNFFIKKRSNLLADIVLWSVHKRRYIYIYSVEHKNRRFHFNFCNEAKQVDISTFFRFNLHIPGVHNSVPSNVNFGPMKWQKCYLFRLCIIFPVQNICSLIAYTNIMLCWNTWCSDNMALQKQVCGNIRDKLHQW